MTIIYDNLIVVLTRKHIFSLPALKERRQKALCCFDKNFSLFCSVGSFSVAVAVNREDFIVFCSTKNATELLPFHHLISGSELHITPNRVDVNLMFLIIFASVDGKWGEQMNI